MPQGLRDGTWELVLKDESVCGAGRALRVSCGIPGPGAVLLHTPFNFLCIRRSHL